MMGGFTVLRLTSMMGMANVNFTKEDLLKMNRQLNKIRKHKSLNGSIGTLNNNAIKVAENSAATIKEVLTEANEIANVVKTYKDEIATLLGEVRKNAEEKKNLEDTLKSVDAFLRTAKLATVELSNEVADLLLLANIPNSKKEELYARHTKALQELDAVEEVISNVGTEA